MVGCTLLSACGGGGSTGGGNYNPQPGPSSSNPPPSSATMAQGTLVDDPSGSPLAGVTVRLDPWQWGNGPVSGAAPAYTPPPNIVPGPSPTPIAVSTTDPQGHFTIDAANGTYLLVIGSDDANDTSRPTIHDRIVLSGQKTLAAPTMPPVPGITPAPVETNGDYRLVTIDQANELPCITDYDAQRTNRGLAKPVIDEWLTENVRAFVAQSITPYNKQSDAANPYGFLTSGNESVTGFVDCGPMASGAFSGAGNSWASESPWYAGAYRPGGNAALNEPAYGASLFPIDPRLFIDHNVPNWL